MKLFFIYLTGFLLIYHNMPTTQVWNKPRPNLAPPGLGTIYQNPRLAALVEGYVLGQKRGVGRKIKREHRHLNLLHLFTPSGLHFSALLLIFAPLIRLFRLPLLPFYFAPFLLNEYYAIKRIAEYKIARSLLRIKGFAPDGYGLFLAVFALDFLIGTYQANPLSYSFSYLFLGIIFSIKDSPKIYWPFALWGGQILVAFCFETPLTHLGFLFGFFLTGIFALLFPLMVLNRLLPWFNFSEVFVDAFARLISLCSEISVTSGYFYPEINLILLVLVLSWGRLPRIIPALLLLLTSYPLYNAPLYAVQQARKNGNIPFMEISTVKRAAQRGELPLWEHRMQIWRP